MAKNGAKRDGKLDDSSSLHAVLYNAYFYPTFTSLLAYLRVYYAGIVRAKPFEYPPSFPHSRPLQSSLFSRVSRFTMRANRGQTRLNNNNNNRALTILRSSGAHRTNFVVMPSNGAESRRRGYNGCVHGEC